jgi:hypothetical protein
MAGEARPGISQAEEADKKTLRQRMTGKYREEK